MTNQINHESDRAVLDALALGAMSTVELARLLDVKPTAARRRLDRLHRSRAIEPLVLMSTGRVVAWKVKT